MKRLVPVFAWLLAASAVVAQDRASFTEQWYLPTTDGAAELYVLEIGQGDPVLVLHGGFGAEHAYLLEAVRGLELRHRFIFYDQRGSLRSRCAADAISVAKHREDLDQLRRELGLDRPTVLAHSMGTHLALRYLEQHPSHVGRMVLVGALPPVAGEHMSEELAALRAEGQQAFQDFTRRPAVQALLERHGMKAEQKSAKQQTDLWRISFAAGNLYHLELWPRIQGGKAFWSQEAAAAALKDFSQDYDFTEALRRHPYPVTVINGDHDLVDFGGRVYRRYVEQNPVVRYVELARAGHNSWIDAPAEFTAALRSALAAE